MRGSPVSVWLWAAIAAAAVAAGCGGAEDGTTTRGESEGRFADAEVIERDDAGESSRDGMSHPTIDEVNGEGPMTESVLDRSAAWRLVVLRGEQLDLDHLGRPFTFVLIDREEPGLVDLDRPAPLRWSVRGAALDATKRHLLLATAGSLAGCHYLAGVEIDESAEEVVVVPRLASKYGEAERETVLASGERIEGCPGPDVSLGMLVTLERPLDGRSVRVLSCVGDGRGDCDAIAEISAEELPVATSAEVGCVPVEMLFELQRDIYERLDRCELDKEPMLGIWD